MTETSVITYLKVIGWFVILAYPFKILARVMWQVELMTAHGVDADVPLESLFTQLIGAVLDIPTSLAFPVLCLFAARYLTTKPDTLETIFE